MCEKVSEKVYDIILMLFLFRTSEDLQMSVESSHKVL